MKTEIQGRILRMTERRRLSVLGASIVFGMMGLFAQHAVESNWRPPSRKLNQRQRRIRARRLGRI